MTRRLWIRIGLVAVVALVAVFVLYPPRKTINLGLDLQGGIHLVLGVDIDKALQVQTERAGDTYHRIERSYGSFARSLRLPRTADGEKIEASFDKGVLTVTVPKAEIAKPRTIEVKTK